jgi:hypothetical protein
MQIPTTEPRNAAMAELHLRIVLKNGLILIVLTFLMGLAAGWALMHWRSAPVGAGLGTVIGIAFVAWFCRMWLATGGLLHHTGLGKRHH